MAPPSTAYTLPLVRRLLLGWPELREGRYPVDQRTVQGYRGKRPFPIGGFEVAIEACADLECAVSRLPRAVQHLVRARYLGNQQRRGGEPSNDTLVHLVWEAMNS